MTILIRARALAAPLSGALLALAAAERSQAQNAVITGKVTSEAGQPIEAANVYIGDLSISVGSNTQGVYSINVPSARVNGQAVNLRVRAFGYQAAVRPIRLTPGTQTVDFSLKQDVNRLSEVIVTGTIEGTERANVPYAVGRLDQKDIPVPAVDPLTALQGKISSVRIAATTGRPGTAPEVLLRAPTSINAQGRSQEPLYIVDGVILRVGSLDELGGLDIESVEVVKGAAGASLYGTTAANGVIVIKTRRGASQEGVRLTARSEYGSSDLNSLKYGMPLNHPLQLDET